MRLETHLAERGISLGEFARRIEAKNARTVQRYVRGERIPSAKMMSAIERETDGEVQPNDFYVSASEA